jgi:hypothetical protein
MRFRVLSNLGLAAAFFVTPASSDVLERWTLSTLAGTATLALASHQGNRPVIMFMCGAGMPGVAQVLVSGADLDIAERRLRIDIESGEASVMTAGERTETGASIGDAVLGEMSIEQVTSLMRSRSVDLTWRVDASERFERPVSQGRMPPPMSRQRTDFLRFCG